MAPNLNLSFRLRRRRGAVAIIVVLALVTLLGVSALVVDLGYATASKQELQAGADAGAHAGAVYLDGTDESLVNAPAAAVAAAGFNEADNSPVVLDPSADITLGQWDSVSQTFSSAATAMETNAIRVTTRRDDLPAWFSHAVSGRTALSAAVEAIGHRSTTGAGQVACFLPLAVPLCAIETSPGSGVYHDEMIFTLNPPSVNNVAWAKVDGGVPSTDYVRDMLTNCEFDGTLDVGDIVGLNNGVLDAALMELADMVDASSTLWKPDWGGMPAQAARSSIHNWGNTFESPIAVIDDPTKCLSPSDPFLGEWPVVGIAWGAVFEVIASGPAAEKNIKMRIDLETPRAEGTGSGGLPFGVQYVKISLVQ